MVSAVGALAATPVAGESLCAYKTEVGAIVYTNTPTKEGLCASAARAPQIAPATESVISKYDSTIHRWAQRYSLSPGLVHAVVSTESAYNPGAVSLKGARGLMQLMPATARRYGVRDSFNPEENIRGGVAHLRDLIDSFGGDLRLAVAAYNAGSRAVQKYSGVPPYPETRDYVNRVLGKMRGTGRSVSRSSSVVKSIGSVELRISDSGSPLLAN